MFRDSAHRLVGVAVLAFMLFVGMVPAVSAAPYCLLGKPFSPPQENCFQFYLADTAVTAPRTMATVGAGGCEVTDYAARQGWLLDGLVPGPHATAGEGDAAMSVVSPYFGDAYQCRGDGGGTVAGPGGTGCTEVQTIDQPEQRDGSGAITVEAARIHVLNCSGNRQIYLYEYLNRTGFRVIDPPNWSQPLGGRDFAAMDEALVVAVTGEAPPDLTGGGDEDRPAQITDANLTRMWQFRPVAFNGQFSGSTRTGWTFSGAALEGVVGSVSCTGQPADLSAHGIEAGGGGRMECTAQFPATANAGSATWRGTGEGRIDWDGFLFKAGGRGVRIDASGTTEDGIEALYLRPGHLPPG